MYYFLYNDVVDGMQLIISRAFNDLQELWLFLNSAEFSEFAEKHWTIERSW